MFKQLNISIYIACLVTFIFLSCAKENQEPEEVSLFNEFIGEWILESESYNGMMIDDVEFYMLNIQEDSNKQDSILTGYYQRTTPGINKDLSIEFTENQNEIILRNWAIFTCTYAFPENGVLELTDVFESDTLTIVGTWVKQ